MPTDTAVAIDVEPGGAFRPVAAIGIAELLGDTVGATFLVRFPSPFFGEQGAGGFGEVWPWLDGFIAGRPLISYGGGYDRKHLGRLLAAAQVPPTGLTVRCALALARRTLGTGWAPDAQTWAIQLWPAEEIERRRAVFRSGAAVSKVILHDAEDDARVCADVVRWAMGRRQEPLGVLLGEMNPLPVG